MNELARKNWTYVSYVFFTRRYLIQGNVTDSYSKVFSICGIQKVKGEVIPLLNYP
jgi:hypothetical protein